jgi:hypothetical protein
MAVSKGLPIRMPATPAMSMPPISPGEMQLLLSRAGLVLNPGQVADLVLAWRQVAGLIASIPHDRPLADDAAYAFHLPPPAAIPVAAAPARPAIAAKPAAPAKPAAKAAARSKPQPKPKSRPKAKGAPPRSSPSRAKAKAKPKAKPPASAKRPVAKPVVRKAARRRR